jgi:phage repressor protein C with HTH and peptisase S24 domain
LSLDAVPTKDPADVFIDRLKALIPDGQSRAFAERVGISEQTFSKWRTGKIPANPKLDTLRRIAAAKRVPIASLISDDTAYPEERGLGGASRVAEGSSHFEASGEDFQTVPVLLEVAAGVPRFAPLDPEEPLRLAFRLRWLQEIIGPTITERTAFLARVRGDSMYPTIRDRDVILVQRWRPPERETDPVVEDGRIYLVQEKDGDGHTVKRLTLVGHELVVYADNPDFPPYRVDLRERRIQRIVLGRVRWIGRKEA